MDYMTVKEASALWGLSERRVQILCKTERPSADEMLAQAIQYMMHKER